jgi:type I restriction enzyme S subunit
VAFLTIGNVSKGHLDFSRTRFVSRRYFDDLDEARVPKTGDLLYTVVGSFGIPVVVDTTTEFCVQRHIAILRPLPSTNVRWMYYWLRSGFVFRQAQASATGIAQPTVGLGSLRSFLIPVPPPEAQGRLVQRLDAIMKLCDDLEGTLHRAETAAAKVAEALVAELVGA